MMTAMSKKEMENYPNKLCNFINFSEYLGLGETCKRFEVQVGPKKNSPETDVEPQKQSSGTGCYWTFHFGIFWLLPTSTECHWK